MKPSSEGDKGGRLPAFFIIGAAKSGTTSLYFYLRQHPQVFMPELKEPGYLCFAEEHPTPADPDAKTVWTSVVFERDAYLRLFSGATPEQKIGEATPEYLYRHDATIATLRRLYGADVSKLRFIAVLRNPVERLWSHYWMFLRDGYEKLEFSEAVAPDTIRRRLAEGWHPSYDYVGFGLYAEQIRAWQTAFGKESLRVILSEDLRKSGPETVAGLFEFLGIRKDFAPETSMAYNVSGKLRHPWIHDLLFRKQYGLKSLARMIVPHGLLQSVKNWLLAWNSEKVEMPPEVRKKYEDLYRDDVRALGPLIDRDLSGWCR